MSVVESDLFQLQKTSHYWIARFTAMAGPCEVFIDHPIKEVAANVARLCALEATRVEKKFSRYRSDNIIHQINTANGKRITLDKETALLIDYAHTCFQISDGLFDITSGILRKAWNFSSQKRTPSIKEVEDLLAFVGWDKAHWHPPYLTLQAGMEIDLGGLGKEYAVDRCAGLIRPLGIPNVLINFGGDLYALDGMHNGEPWRCAIEDPSENGKSTNRYIELVQGAVATSGNTKRYIEHNGKRYGHILNPKTGWPIENAPRSVTVLANTCIEAGVLSSLAMLQGADAETFLSEEGVTFHLIH